MSLRARLLDLIYPSRCVVCRRYIGPAPPGVCPDCLRTLPEPQKDGKRGELYRRSVSVFSYEGSLRESLLRYKFGGKSFYAGVYGPLLAAKIEEDLAGQYDLISWVPISRRRRWKRGYDQAKLLALAAGNALNQPVVQTLKKVRHVPPQSRISSPAERRANIQNAYRPLRPQSFRDKRVLLIDDILTTGATLTEASRTLLTAGAAEVVCATLALTPRKQSR